MLDELQLRKLSHTFNVPLGIIEKDYILTKFLFHLQELKSTLVFKGGTAIKKVYVDGSRFSEDLDFTGIKKIGKEEIQKILPELNFQLKIKDITKFKLSQVFTLSYVGPLQYKNSFKLDISYREKPLLKVKEKEIIHFYPDIEKFSFPTLTLEEIIAEKLRATYTRGKARDILDIYFLSTLPFHKTLVKKIFLQKLKIIEIQKAKPSLFQEKVENFDQSEIRYLIPNKIDKKKVIQKIKESYSFLFS